MYTEHISVILTPPDCMEHCVFYTVYRAQPCVSKMATAAAMSVYAYKDGMTIPKWERKPASSRTDAHWKPPESGIESGVIYHTYKTRSTHINSPSLP